jgi:hypothetical protein
VSPRPEGAAPSNARRPAPPGDGQRSQSTLSSPATRWLTSYLPHNFRQKLEHDLCSSEGGDGIVIPRATRSGALAVGNGLNSWVHYPPRGCAGAVRSQGVGAALWACYPLALACLWWTQTHPDVALPWAGVTMMLHPPTPQPGGSLDKVRGLLPSPPGADTQAHRQAVLVRVTTLVTPRVASPKPWA